MIFTDRTITVRKGESRIDEPIVVYRGDYELEVRFTILNSKFRFMSGTNLIESEKASYGQLAILTPYGGNIFSDIVRCNDGSVTFVLTAEMLNQIEEVGLYSFQIRLMDYNRESRVSIPPIEFGIEVREPIASEDHDNSVNNAIVGYSIAKVVDPKEENVGDTFDKSGNYNKTKWETGDRISEGKLNKIEDAIDKINQNEKSDVSALDKRISNHYNVLDSIKADKNQVFTMDNMGPDIKLAMTGGSVPVVGTNAVNTDNIMDKSINADKIWNQNLYTLLFYEGNTVPDFTFNDTNKTLTLTLPETCYMVVGSNYKLLGENDSSKRITIPYPAEGTGLNILCWTERTKEFQLINYKDYSDFNLFLDKEKYLIATIGLVKGKSVMMPGRYTINGKEFTTDDVVETNHIKNYAITRSKLHPQVQPVRIFANGVINFVFEHDHIRMFIPRNAFIVSNEWFKNINPDNAPYIDIRYPEFYDGIIYLLYEISKNTFRLVRFNEIDSFINNNDILFVGLVGVGLNKSDTFICIDSDYVVDGGLPCKEFHLTFTEPIIYDRYAHKIKIPPFFIQNKNMTYKEIRPEYCGIESDYFEYSIPDGYDIHMLCLDYQTVMNWVNGYIDGNQNPIKRYPLASMPLYEEIHNNICVIATMVYGELTTIYPYNEIGGLNDLGWASFNSQYPIEFDWSKREIRYGFGFIQYKNNYFMPYKNEVSDNVIPISNTNDGIQWLLFNINEGTFRTYRYVDDTPIDWNQRWVIVATFWIDGQVQTLSNYTINGKPYGIDLTSFVADNARLLLPNKMYLVKGEDLPIYMTSIIPSSNEITNLNPTIRYKEGNNMRMDTFVDGYDLVSDKLQSGFRIGYTQNADAKLHYKDISVSYCDPAAISNKSPKILHIGDSITNRYVAVRNEVFLKHWGITPTYVGTLYNMGGRRGEGREGWEYTNFIGMSSIWGNNNSIIVPDVGSTTTDLNLNPFLKVASNEDKFKYPDWCFTYNQVLRETSYADTNDKSQTFYIFDIENYLSAHSVDMPDIITIALSTNDINRREDYLETCLFSMNVMISRIREQLPNVKIGIIPSPAWGYGDDTFRTRTAGWIEECMTAINARNDNNVFIVPIWCHMNRVWGFPTTDTDLSAINNSKSANISDTIHPDSAGQEQYGKAMAMFIANMCL